MECPDCGLPVLVADGAIAAHLRPDTLEPCTAKAKAESPAKREDAPAPAHKDAAKTPASKQTTSKTKTHRKS